MATGRVPTTANSPLTAKGDLFTYSTTQARLAVGSDGETLVADSSASQGLRWQTAANGNFIINGAQEIWQRGTSFTTSGATYTADRWQGSRSGVAGMTVSRQTTSDTTNLPFIQYCARIQRDSGNTNTSILYYATTLESEDSRLLQGQTVVLSFYARAGANYSSASSALTANISYGTGTNQNIFTGFTGQTTVVQSAVTLTTTWQRFSITGTVATTATQLGAYFFFTPVGTAGASDFFEVTGMQLERGSVPTSFKRAGGTLAGELDACKRYAQNINYSLSGKNVYNTVANGSATGATSSRITLYLPVPMRVAPTSVTFTASGFVLDNVASAPTVTGVTINQGGTDTVLLTVDASAGALTNKDPVIMYANNNSSANLILSAEL